MPFRRRRNIRSYVKIGIGIILFLFLVSLIHSMGQIQNETQQRSKSDGQNSEKWSRLREKVVGQFQYSKSIDIPPVQHDLDIDQNELKRTMSSLQKLVHLDLKGSPPKISYLKELIPFVKNAGATGVLIEYEDYFPYSNDLEAIGNQNRYTKSELTQIFELLKEYKMSMIPLVQTYGHLEFVLKLKQFAYLREASQHFQVISPCINDTYEKVVFRMIDQILEAHPQEIEYLHIGCDEVYHVNVNPACKTIENLRTVHDFFIYHVDKVVEYIKTKRPNLKVMIWEDMIRKNMISEIDKDLVKLAKKVVPVVWNYRETVEITENTFKIYDDLFSEIWMASAFKGATRQLELIPNAKLHYNNHLSWLNVIRNFPSTHKIKGIVLTGWSRYDHMQSICETLPAAIPSLVLCLQTMVNYDQSDLFIFSRAKELTKCTYNKTSTGFIVDPAQVLSYRISYQVDDVLSLYECDFPGSGMYKWLLSLKLINQFFLSRHERFGDVLNEYNLKYNFFNTMVYEDANKFYSEFENKFNHLKSIGEKEFDKFFYADLFEELTNVYIDRNIELIKLTVSKLSQIKLPDSAPIRPFNKIQNQPPFVAA